MIANRWAFVTVLAAFPLLTGMAVTIAPYATYTFGISMATGVGNQLYTCYLVKELDNRVIATEPMTVSEFILQAQGVKPSTANPDGRNFFLENRINTCLAFEDTEAAEFLYRCDPLEDLWKLRFQEYPFLLSSGQQPGSGWAETRNAPSARQMLLLADYGILYLTGLCRGKDMFRLLHDMTDSSWVSNYRQGL
mgnify:CR=1 FL=1